MNLPRWWFGMLAVTLAAIAGVAVVSSAQLSVLLYKGALVCVAVTLSTLVDRWFFSKPGRKDAANANIARAIVFAAIMLGISLGL